MAREEFDAMLDAALRGHDVELIALAGYMRLLSDGFVEKWEGRILNIHPSLLPLHKGLDTHRRALIAGDEYAGCSVHLVTAGARFGPGHRPGAGSRSCPATTPKASPRACSRRSTASTRSRSRNIAARCGQRRRMAMTADDPERRTAAAEAAATRRRWINLAEFVAVAGLLISGLALWNSYQERSGEETDKVTARKQAQAQAMTMVLRGTADREGERLSLAPADPEQTIQSQVIVFPMALAVTRVETMADPRLEAAWFRREILRATANDSGHSEARAADRRVPVAITTRFYRDGALFTDTAVYYIVYRVEGGGLFDSREIRLRGLARLDPGGADSPDVAKNRINELWRSRR